MHYTARSVTASCAPWSLTVGRRTYLARPLSAALVLRLLPDLAHASTRPTALRAALDAAFPAPPQPWWDRVLYGKADPVRVVLAMEETLQASIVERLFAVPGAGTAAEMTPEEILIAAHRKMAHPTESGRGPTLALACLTCEVKLGASWYFNPSRWSTADGYAPLALVWTQYRGLMALDAQERLSLASSVKLGMGDGDQVRRASRKIAEQAFPRDPSVVGEVS